MSPPSDYSLRLLEIEQCRQEIVAVEAAILGGHPDVEGLCRALADWSEELRMLQNEATPPGVEPGGVGGEVGD